MDALVIDRRWAWAAALNRSSPAAEVHVNVALAEAERGEASGEQAAECQMGRIKMQLN